MKDKLESFIREIPNLDRMASKELVAFFAFFLTEVAGDTSVKPKRIRDCFEAAFLAPPANISDVMGKSNFFVATKSGTQLQRAIRNRIADAMSGDATSKAAVAAQKNGDTAAKPEEVPTPPAVSVAGVSKNVMVVYGRDQALRDDVFGFLRALKLNPIEWSEAVRATGKALLTSEKFWTRHSKWRRRSLCSLRRTSRSNFGVTCAPVMTSFDANRESNLALTF